MNRFITLLLLVCFLAVSFPGACGHHHDAGKGGSHALADTCASPSGHDDGHGDVDSCADCPCHSFTMILSFPFSVPRTVSSLEPVGKTPFIPEVHLPKFIPPQNA